MNVPFENKSNKQILKVLIIGAFGLFVANTWNNFITNTIDTIYPLQVPENKWKRILILFIYSIIITLIFIVMLKILNKFL
jgi:TRAP-type C4-dicarboxylate transport system permease small subunit